MGTQKAAAIFAGENTAVVDWFAKSEPSKPKMRLASEMANQPSIKESLAPVCLARADLSAVEFAPRRLHLFCRKVSARVAKILARLVGLKEFKRTPAGGAAAQLGVNPHTRAGRSMQLMETTDQLCFTKIQLRECFYGTNCTRF